MTDTQILTIALSTAPTMLLVLVGILINNARLGDTNTPIGETNTGLVNFVHTWTCASRK